MAELERIQRVYFDLPEYIKPIEVQKVFRLMDKRQKLMREIESYVFDSSEKQKKEIRLAEINEDIQLTSNVIATSSVKGKKYNWQVNEHTHGHKSFWVFIVSEPVEESLFDGGQDDGN